MARKPPSRKPKSGKVRIGTAKTQTRSGGRDVARSSAPKVINGVPITATRGPRRAS